MQMKIAVVNGHERQYHKHTITNYNLKGQELRLTVTKTPTDTFSKVTGVPASANWWLWVGEFKDHFESNKISHEKESIGSSKQLYTITIPWRRDRAE